jgi:hypothetical protein
LEAEATGIFQHRTASKWGRENAANAYARASWGAAELRPYTSMLRLKSWPFVQVGVGERTVLLWVKRAARTVDAY